MAFSISYTYRLLDKFSPALQKINKTQQKFNATLKRSQEMVKKFSERMNNMQGVLAGVGGVFISYKLIDTFNQFQTSMNQLSAVSRGTREHMEKFRAVALQLGATTRFTAGEVTEGMVYLKMAGLSVSEVLEAIPGMLDLAAAGGINLAEASDLATNMLLQQGLAVEELARVSDNLATIQTTTNTSILEAGDAMKNVLTTASMLGFELEHTTALIGAMANVGVKSFEAGTLLRNAMIRLVNPSRLANRTLRKLGIDLRKFTTPEGKIKNFNKLLTLLTKRGATAGDIFNIFQERGARAILALKKVGETTIQRLIQLQEEGVKLGMAAEMARRQMAGMPGMLLSLKSAFEALQIAMVEVALADKLIVIGENITKVTRYLTIAHPELVGFVGIFISIGVAIMAAVAAIVILAPIIKALVNPIGAVILAVALLISFWAAFYKNNKKLQEAFLIVQGALVPLWQTIKSFFRLFSEDNLSLVDLITSAILGLAKAFGFLMKGVNWALKPLKRFLDIRTGKLERAMRAEEMAAEYMQDIPERMRLRDMQDMWQKQIISGREAIIKAQEQLMKKETETTLNGEIKVTATEGTQVEKATMEIIAPGNLGFNMAGS